MAVHLDVQTQFDDRSVRSTADDLQRYLKRSGDSAGQGYADGITKSTPKIEQAMKKVADATGKVRVEQEKYNQVLKEGGDDAAKKVAQYERLSKAQRDHALVTRTAAREIQDATSSAGASFMQLGTAVGSLSRLGGPVVMAGLTVGVVKLAGVAAAASGALGVLPAAIGGVATAVGTLKLATMGLDDAFENMNDPEKFAESLGSLAPSAQQAMLSIRSMMPALTELQQATQDALFGGVGQQLTQVVNTTLPTVERMTTGVAGAFNSMFTELTQELQTPEIQASLNNITTNVVQAFQSLTPAVEPLTQAFTDLTSVGASFLPEIAQGAANAAQSFADFVSEARQSGQLQEWISDGLGTMKELGGIALDVGRAFVQLAEVGKTELPELGAEIKSLADNMNAFIEVTKTAAHTIQLITDPINGVQGFMEQLGIIDPQTVQGPTGNGNLPPGMSGGGGSFGPGPSSLSGFGLPSTVDRSIPWDQLSPADKWLRADAAAHPQGNSALQPGMYRRRDGSIGYTAPPSLQTGGRPGVAGSSSTASLPQSPSLPIQYTPTAGLPSSIANAITRLDEAKHDVAEKEARVNQLQESNVATADEIQKAKNDLAKAEQDRLQADRALNDAKISAANQQTKQIQGVSQSLQEFGAQLDSDFGISKGLPGIVENLVKMAGNIIAAPALMQLQAISNANPNQGSGLIGMLGSAGAFGPQYMPGAAAQSGYSGYTPAPSIGPLPLQGYPGDAALLANVPAGRYTQSQRGDLTQGLADCSSAVEDLVNILDGRSTAGASMYTGNASQWLQSRGFLPGMGGPGDFRVGFNSGHMQATLPGGTPFNWGSDASAANRGIGGTGADDPAFTSHFFRPMSAGPLTGATGYPMPDLYGAANTNPMLTPGIAPAGLQTQAASGQGMLGAPAGMAYPSAGGGGFQGLGGLPMAALSTAASAMPGVGAAAQVGMQLANRVIAYGGQVAGIGISGLLETLSVGDNPMGSFGNSWLGKAAGGFAGARPALPNMAGKPVNAPEGQPSQMDSLAQKGGNVANINITNQGATPDQNGKDVAAHTAAMWAPAGRQ
ncbi:MAG: hypothetical protein AB1925_03860 [Actinomycetota bacterium]